MPEQVNIASLTIDVDDVIKESVRLQKEITKTKELQKDLDRTTEDGAAAYELLDAQLKNTKKSYRDNQQFVSALDAANEDLNKTMSVQNKSTQELRDSRRVLNQISKQIVGNTEDEIELREQLNVAIDEQTEALREQGSEFNAGKDKIGEYTQGINASDLSLQSFITQSQDAGGATKLVSSGLKGAAKSMIGFTKATLAFLLTPVGLVLAAIAGAFLLIKNAMNRSEESTTKIKKAFSAFTGIVSGVLKALQPLGDFLINIIVWYLGLVEKAAFGAAKALSSFLKFVGLDEAAASVESFTQGIQDAVKASKELTEAELGLAKAQRISRKVQLEFLKGAEKLRQIRDDESKTMPERIKANKELGELLAKQSKEELILAQNALDVANLRIKLEGETTEALDARAEALTEIADIEERITGQQSEQLVNTISLQKEAAEKIKKIKDKELSAAEKLAKEKEKLAKLEADKAIEIARFELNEYIRNNQSKLESSKFLTEQLVEEEKKRLELLAEQQKEFAATELENGAISQIEFNNRIAEINAEHQISVDELEAERKEVQKVQAAIDAENELILLDQSATNKFDVERQFLEAGKKAELEAAEQTGADKALIEKKYANIEKDIAKEVSDSKAQLAADAFGFVAELLGEQTVAGKAAGIAQAGINTYLGVTQVLAAPSVLPEPAGTIAKGLSIATVIATGLGAVSKIVSTPTKLASGGMVKGKGTSKSDSILALLSNGESVNNAKSTSMFAPIYSELNMLGGGKRFANGGIAGGTSRPSSGSLIDYNLIADKIAEANKSLPVPNVAVSEIQRVANNVMVVENLASG